MAKGRICSGCAHSNNGWCRAKQTNKGLKDLVYCELRKTDSLVKVESYLQQKQFELGVDNNAYNRGIVKGLEIALALIKE